MHAHTNILSILLWKRQICLRHVSALALKKLWLDEHQLVR